MARAHWRTLFTALLLIGGSLGSGKEACAHWRWGCWWRNWCCDPCVVDCCPPCWYNCCETDCWWESCCDMSYGVAVEPQPMIAAPAAAIPAQPAAPVVPKEAPAKPAESSILGPEKPAAPKESPRIDEPAPKAETPTGSAPGTLFPKPAEKAPPTFNPVVVPGKVEAPRTGSGMIAVHVPEQAKVYINGKPTTSIGARREYVSFGLEDGNTYRYEVQVLVPPAQAGQQWSTMTKVVTITAGQESHLSFLNSLSPDRAIVAVGE